jgi:endonuclease YncB( thermonuclease family)
MPTPRAVLATFAVSLALLATPAAAQRAIDGDTIKPDGQAIRLRGMDAPELHQICDGGRRAPGPLARDALAALIAGQPIECQSIARDRYGRTVEGPRP